MRLSADVLARIFLGEITRWDDPALAALSPDEPLPRAPIVVVTRADGSGTSAAFTEYLANANPRFEAKVGTGLTVSFPVGLSALGNAGVTSQVRSTPNAVGDAELSFAAPASDGAYPVAALSYVVVRQEQPDTRKALALVRFLAWVLRDEQALATPLGYAPLPDAPLQYARGALATLRSHGKPLTPGLAFD